MYHLLPTVFVVIAALPELVRPAHVCRGSGATLLMVDPETLRAELAFWMPENLTPEERTVLRIAYDIDGSINDPVADRHLGGRLSDTPIPEMVRPPDIVVALRPRISAPA